MEQLFRLETESEKILPEIKLFIANNTKEGWFKAEFPNPILRDDTLDLLDKFCTVIYFPLKDEINNGFHITDIPQRNGENQHFVFINTAQTIEKQVFTAAHELGHIWKVDDHVFKACTLKRSEDLSEHIINRFAAELLMPEEIFIQFYQLEYKKYQNQDGKITVSNMLRVITALMNQFFTPTKSIIIRCYELGVFNENIANLLLGMGCIEKDKLNTKIAEIIRDSGYVRFQKPNMKKWIEGLPELLDRAEKTNAVSSSKIENMRKMFCLEKEMTCDEIDSIIS